MKDRNNLKNKSDLNDLKTDLEKAKISENLRENEKYLRERLENCSDILIRPMKLGVIRSPLPEVCFTVCESENSTFCATA